MKNNPTLKLTSMLIPNLNRKIATVVAGFLVTCGAFTIANPIASADNGCDSYFGCGTIENNTGGHIIHYVVDPYEANGSKPPANPTRNDNWGYCYVWNWHSLGEVTNINPVAERVICNQNLSISNGKEGGYGVDVDDFTFTDQGYHERLSEFGTWHYRDAGVWTRIHNGENANCSIGKNNQIWCTIELTDQANQRLIKLLGYPFGGTLPIPD